MKPGEYVPSVPGFSRIHRQQPDGLGGQSIAWLCYDGLSAGSNGCGGSQSFKGALSGTWSAASSTTYTRDALLRVTASAQATDPYIGGFTYYYNVDGTIESMTYPSASTVTYAYDRAGRPNAVSRGTESIASSVLYAPHGAVESLTLGNGLFERVLYNNRLQPYQMNLGTSSGSGNVWSLANTYGDPGANNGNVLEQLITAPGADAARQVYKYDHVNRLKLFTEKATNVDARTCQAAAAPLCEEFGYDQWGNRRIVDRSGVGPSLSEPGEFSSATNRITTAGFAYDGGAPGPGNLTTTPAGAFAYDAENRMISATTALGTTQYLYDAEGRRVKKVEGTTATVYVYDAAGQLAAEYGGTAPASTTRAYLTQDHLGSTRVVTNKEGTEVVERRDYMPFGEEIAAPEGSWRLSVPGYMNAAATTLKFTGKERDGETGLDYFGARYFSGVQGRFTTPDKPFTDQHPEEPQSWNLYSYARNTPLRLVDEQGRAVFESAAKLMQAGKDVMGRKSLQPVPRVDSSGKPVLDSKGRPRYDTFCNFGVQQILEAGDDRTLDGMTAAKMTTYLRNSDNATELSYEDAVGYAKDGATVVFAEPGHVVVVAPADMQRPGPSWRSATGEQQVPVVFNVGKENKQMRLDQAWGPAQGKNARPYILNTDKKKVDELRKQRKSDDEENPR